MKTSIFLDLGFLNKIGLQELDQVDAACTKGGFKHQDWIIAATGTLAFFLVLWQCGCTKKLFPSPPYSPSCAIPFDKQETDRVNLESPNNLFKNTDEAIKPSENVTYAETSLRPALSINLYDKEKLGKYGMSGSLPLFDRTPCFFGGVPFEEDKLENIRLNRDLYTLRHPEYQEFVKALPLPVRTYIPKHDHPPIIFENGSAHERLRYFEDSPPSNLFNASEFVEKFYVLTDGLVIHYNSAFKEEARIVDIYWKDLRLKSIDGKERMLTLPEIHKLTQSEWAVQERKLKILGILPDPSMSAPNDANFLFYKQLKEHPPIDSEEFYKGLGMVSYQGLVGKKPFDGMPFVFNDLQLEDLRHIKSTYPAYGDLVYSLPIKVWGWKIPANFEDADYNPSIEVFYLGQEPPEKCFYEVKDLGFYLGFDDDYAHGCISILPDGRQGIKKSARSSLAIMQGRPSPSETNKFIIGKLTQYHAELKESKLQRKKKSTVNW